MQAVDAWNSATGSPEAKVPAVTLSFWIVKILATTLGETGGDALSMSMDLGYLVSSGIFAVIFVVAIAMQIRSLRFVSALYWFTIVATTTLGTTLADFSTRSLGIGYAGGSALLLALLLTSLLSWWRLTGSIAVESVSSPSTETFYWVTVMFSQTLGTALGDWTADSMALGYDGAAIVFGVLLAVIALGYYRTQISRTMLFWAAFVLTRPLGAVVGDYLDKPLDKGGLDLSRFGASSALLVAIVALLVVIPQRAGRSAH